MTFQTDQIQAMIAEIDGVLNQSSRFGLSWLNSKETTQQRRVLEQVRYNLQNLQQQLARSTPVEPKPLQSSQAAGSNPPLEQARSEIASLRQQRQALIQEIQQLEQQRQNYLSQEQQSTPQQQAIAEFWQALMGNLQETLTPQLLQTLSHLETEFLYNQSTLSAPDAAVTNITLSPQWQAQVEQLRKQQNRLDRLLKTLDSKLKLMFETLQLNVQKYQVSFSQGLEKMHSLSAESEAMLTEMIAEMERELDPALQPSSQLAIAAPETTIVVLPSTGALSEQPPSLFNQDDTEDLPLPYAGFEWKPSTQPVYADNRTETEKESIEKNIISGQVYGGMAALVAETDKAARITPPPSPASDTGDIDNIESADTISSLTDLIDSGSLPPEDLLDLVEAKPVGDETNLEEFSYLDRLLDTEALEETRQDVSSLDQPESLELGESAENLIEQIEADLNLEEIPTTEGEEQVKTEENEEVAAEIPDEILAEFDELFGATTQEAAINVSEIEADLNPKETEKKNLASTERIRKAATRDSNAFVSKFDAARLTHPRFWYLGIDIGTTGISAALLNAKTRQVYPITWQVGGEMDEKERLFRLPAWVYLKQQNGEDGNLVIALEASEEESGILLKNLKQYLKIGLTYYSDETNKWEPEIQQWNFGLNWVRQALQTLVSTLKPKTENQENTQAISPMMNQLSALSSPFVGGIEGGGKISIAAVGLEPENLNAALSELAGAIASTPAEWSEAYRFNVREAILAANLVESAAQICFVEEAIASAVAQIVQANCIWRGDTLIIHAGATTTELGLVEIPENMASLSYSDFACRSFPYAGNFIDQDIICQLLLNAKIVNQLIEGENSSLDLPIAGEPDLATRYSLQQILESSPTGQILLEAAKHLKLNLQNQDSSTLEIDRYRWVLQRQELENLVYLPFIQCLNRELNSLLVRQGVAVESIRQVICTGGTARIAAIREWLRQKLPNATLIQDTDQNASVALGLVTLPLYPQLLDAPRHQYGDYFLLLELLETLREQPLSVGKITQLLERRGINTSACQQRILAYLEGYLPAGIVPSYAEALLLTKASRQNAAIASTPLFHKEDNQTYCLNTETSDRLRHYFNAVLQPTRQTFDEPLGVYWLTPKINE